MRHCLRSVGVLLIALFGFVMPLCITPGARAQTKIVNGQAMLPWVTGDYEKPVIIEVVGDSNATTGTGASSPNTSNNNHFYHSIYNGMLKWTPYAKLGGFEPLAFLGQNPALTGLTGSAGYVGYWEWASTTGFAPGQATPGGNTTGINPVGLRTKLFAATTGDGFINYWTLRGGASAWAADSDWYYDNTALELKMPGMLTPTVGLSTAVLRATRGGTESAVSDSSTISSPTIDVNTAMSMLGTEAFTSYGLNIAASTNPLLRIGMSFPTGVGATVNTKRINHGVPLLRRATPERGAPVFASDSVGGWSIRNFDSSAGYDVGGVYTGKFTDTALQARIAYLVNNAGGTRTDVTLIVWMRTGTNDAASDSASAAAWNTRAQAFITRYRAAAAAVGVTPHFVLDSPSDPGGLPGPSYTQSIKFDRIEQGNALAAAALDTPSSRVIVLNKRAILNARDPGCNGTMRGPYNASTNTVGGIVDETTDVHLNVIGAEIEVDGIWDAATAEWPVKNGAQLGLVDTTRRMLQDREPFFWIQFFGDNYGGGGNPNGIRGDAYSDVAGFVQKQMAKASGLGFKRIMLHTPGGKLYSSTGFYYGADQRRIMPASFKTYFGGQFRTDLARFGLKADVYIGAVWEPLADPTTGYAPMLDPVIEEDYLTSEVLYWKTTAGMQRVWFDAIGTYTENATRKISVDRTGDWLLARGFESGGEPIPIINSGGWRIDETRAYDRPWMVTETALNGFSNNANYRVPEGAVMYVVFAANEATPARVRQRINQGFVVCAWDDTDAATAIDMLQLQDVGDIRSRTRGRSRRIGHKAASRKASHREWMARGNKHGNRTGSVDGLREADSSRIRA